MNKLVRWTLLILCGLTLIAAIGLLRYDYKERSWYNENKNIRKQRHIDTSTVVCILATVHQATSNYNADSIVAILDQFQPDLILTEEDTLLFKTVHKHYNETLKKPLFARLGRSFGFGSPEEIEGRAVRKYKMNYPPVHIRPFDYEGRNAFYIKNNTFSKENEISRKLEVLALHQSLTPEQAKIWATYHNINDTLNQLSNQTPYSINQQTYYDLTKRRQEYQYQKVADIVYASDSLDQYRNFYLINANFWDARNKKMVEHIANFISQYPNKRVMVLTGSMHKYYLLKELVPLQNRLKFTMKEYYE